MMRLTIVLAPCLLSLPAAAATGVWATEGYSARVRIAACPHSADALCGTIVWLWDPTDEAGQPRRDAENPDPDKRRRPLVGTVILQGFQADGPGRWRGGTIYNPEDGRSYAGTLRLKAPDLLEVSGCVLMFCREQVWRAAASVCPGSATERRGAMPRDRRTRPAGRDRASAPCRRAER